MGTTDNVKFNNITGSNNISASGNLSITGNVDVDGTSNFAGNVTMQNDLSVTGRINAEEIHTTFISASITTTTGSNVFGDSVTDSHQFTGSVDVSGSLRVSDGNVVISDTLTATNIGAFTAAGAIDFDNQNMTNVDIDSGDISGTNISGGAGSFSALTSSNDVTFRDESGAESRFLFDVGGAGDNPKFIVFNNDGSTQDFKIDNGTITSVSGASFGDKIAIGMVAASSSIHINENAPTIRLQDKNNANDTFAQLNANSSAGSLEIEADGNNTKSGTEIIFRVDGDEVFKLDNLGNLGVGQAAKGFAGGLGLIHGAHDHKGGGNGFIHISGSVPRIIMEDGGDTPSYAIEAQDNFKIIQLDESSTGEVTSLTIKSGSGHIGIGNTSPTAPLDVTVTAGSNAKVAEFKDSGGNGIEVAINNSSPFRQTIGVGGGETLGLAANGTTSVKLVLDANTRLSLSNNDDGSSNTIFGNSAAANLDAGSNFNTFIGHAVAGGATMNDGSDNVAIGFESMKALTSGDDNVAVGMRTLLDMDTGVRNTALGDSAGRSVTSGTDNVFVGSTAGHNTTTAAENVFVGAGAGDDTNASQSVFVGAAAGGTANNGAAANTYIGYNAGANDSAHHGGKNVAIGHNTAKSQTTAAKNVIIGASAASSMAIGDHNVIIGFEAALDNTRDGLVIIGSNAGRSLSSGDNNVFVGFNTGPGVTTGDHNTLVGDEAGRDLAGGSSHTTLIGLNAGLKVNTNGDTNNTMVGSEAGNDVTSGTECTALGVGTRFADTSNNQTCLGVGATTDSANDIAIGNTSVDEIKGQVSFSTFSDERIKKNIIDGDLGLDFINLLKPRKFNKVNPAEYPDSIKKEMDGKYGEWTEAQDTKVWDGLIAQEVKSAMDTCGTTFSGWNEETNSKQVVAYEALVVPLIKAVQELSVEITNLKAQVSGSN